MSRAHRIATKAARAALAVDGEHRAVMPPLHLSANFAFDAPGVCGRFDYTRSGNPTRALLADGTYDVAFVLRPIPVDQVREICESDANMPPKSTYFFPKVPTGIVFNPVG